MGTIGELLDGAIERWSVAFSEYVEGGSEQILSSGFGLAEEMVAFKKAAEDIGLGAKPTRDIALRKRMTDGELCAAAEDVTLAVYSIPWNKKANHKLMAQGRALLQHMHNMMAEIMEDASDDEAEDEAGGDAVGSIEVKDLTGRTYDIFVRSRGMTVRELKEEISGVSNVPPDQQRLIYAGLQMEDAMPVGFYNLHAGCLVHLVLRLVGD